MSRKPKTRRAASAPMALRPGPNWALLALSSLGILLTGYLTWTAWTGAAVTGCAAGGGCDLVLSSQWARLFGLPTAFWGLLAYGGLAALAFEPQVTRHWSRAWTVAFFGVCYSVYLTTISLMVVGSTCPYCLTSLGLMTATLAVVSWQRPQEMAIRPWRRVFLGRGVLAACAILLIHLSYSSPAAEALGPEDPAVRALAEHLTKDGARFYGASWCPHCQEQKRLFGASAHRLPYIECGAGGPRAPAAPSCRAAGVVTYPTWIIGGRATTEVMSLRQLANATGYAGAGSFP
jgi:uncharacterized membrane protein/glutaredoxin